MKSSVIWVSSVCPTERELDAMLASGDEVIYLGEIFPEFQEDIENGDNSVEMCEYLVSALLTHFGEDKFRVVYPDITREGLKCFYNSIPVHGVAC